AKGLEFAVVLMVGLAQNKVPWPRRREALELPVELINEVLPSGDFHIQEERRLFYVGMTRARRELYLTSARDYGGTRERKVSQFVLEALDLSKDAARPFKAKAVEEIERNAPPAPTPESLTPIPPGEELRISHKQVDDYQTCPLKYKYVHVLRVPILRHHTVAYGAIIHRAVEYYLLRRAAGNFTPLAELLDAYERAWAGDEILKGRPGASVSPAEGFLTREHEEARKAAGRHAPTEEDLTDAIAQVKAAALGIRARKFEATPSYNACRYCAYNQVCPFTATRS